MPGLLSFFNDPEQMGLLGVSSGLLQAGGPSRLPVGFGAALGQGLQQGAQAAQATQANNLNNLLGQAQLQRALTPANPFGKIDPKDYTPESLQAFTASGRVTDLVPVRPLSVSPAGTAYDPYKLTPGQILPQDPNKPFALGSDGRPVANQAFQDFDISRHRAGAPQVNVGPTGIDYGAPPSGMAWARTQDGKVALKPGPQGFMQPIAVPIAGGPVEAKAEEKKKAEEAKRAQQVTYADVVTQDVDRALDIVEKSSVPVTGFGAFASAVPGTKAHDLSNLLNTIKANAGFDRLQQMRASSPTGGALGAVSEMENKLLQSTIGSVEQSQSKEQFIYNMKRLKDLYLDIIHGPGNRPGSANGGKPSQSYSQEDLEFTAKKHGISVEEVKRRLGQR